MMKAIYLSFFLASFSFGQGPLDPPPGSPAPTYKSLQEIWDKIEDLEAENSRLQNELRYSRAEINHGMSALFTNAGISFPWRNTSPREVSDSSSDTYGFTLSPLSGHPSVATNSLREVYFSEFDGSQWHQTTIETVRLETGIPPVITYTAEGTPCVAYVDKLAKKVKFAYRENDGSWITEVVANANGGENSYLSIASGSSQMIGISFFGSSNDLMYAEKASPSQKEWAVTTVDSDGNVGAWTSLAFSSGQPAIAYKDLTQDRLKYASRTSLISNWNIEIIDDTPGAGQGVSLKRLSFGKAIVSYKIGTNIVNFSQRVGPSSWNKEEITNDSSGNYTSLNYSQDLQIVATYVKGQDLMYAEKKNTWEISDTTYNTSSGDPLTLLFLPSGQPIIASRGNGYFELTYRGLAPRAY